MKTWPLVAVPLEEVPLPADVPLPDDAPLPAEVPLPDDAPLPDNAPLPDDAPLPDCAPLAELPVPLAVEDAPPMEEPDASEDESPPLPLTPLVAPELSMADVAALVPEPLPNDDDDDDETEGVPVQMEDSQAWPAAQSAALEHVWRQWCSLGWQTQPCAHWASVLHAYSRLDAPGSGQACSHSTHPNRGHALRNLPAV